MTLKRTFRKIRADLNRKDRVREAILALTRQAVRLSAQAILAMHRGALKAAESRLKGVRGKLKRIEEVLKACPEIAYTSPVYTAYQEYAEAQLLLNFIQRKELPSFEDLEMSPIPFVLGLADFVGELRRRALDSLRKGDVREAERCLKAMEEVYDAFITIDRGYALIPGFRRKCDLIRARIEQTRGDVSIAKLR